MSALTITYRSSSRDWGTDDAPTETERVRWLARIESTIRALHPGATVDVTEGVECSDCHVAGGSDPRALDAICCEVLNAVQDEWEDFCRGETPGRRGREVLGGT